MRHPELLASHGTGIISIRLKKAPKPCIFRLNRILSDLRQEEERDQRAENTQRTTQIERVLSLLDDIGASVGDDVGEDVCANEGANLAGCGGDTVVLASDGGCGGLGGNEANVVTWADFS